MSDKVDLDGVRRGVAHLDRAAELMPDPGARRPVPVADIVAEHHVLTVPEIAELVRMHPISIRREIRAGRLRAAQAGSRGHYRVTWQALNDWWASRGGGPLKPAVL